MSENSGAAAPAVAPVESAPVDSNTSSVQSQANSGQAAPDISDIQDAVDSGEISPQEAKSMIRKFKLKVDGKEFDHEIDLSDENAVRQELQLAHAAKKRMAETADIKKAYQREMQRLKDDPFSVLQELGIDPEELSTSFISKKIEEMKKSPEQLANEKMQKELEEARAEAKKLKEEKEQEQMSKLQEQAVKSLNEEIDKAISGHKKLPNSPLVRKKIADTMLWAMNNGHGEVSAEDVIPLVEKEMRQEFGSLFDGLEDEGLEEWIGRERISKMRKKRLATKPPVPGLSSIQPTAAGMKAPVASSEPVKKIKAKDLFRNLGK